MFQRLRQFLGTKAPAPTQQDRLSPEKITFESLWDDYERRTWHHQSGAPNFAEPDHRLSNWIGSISQSGHTREKCLRALITNFEPGDENRILLRLVDWVPQVQVLATHWVLSYFHSLPLEAISKNQRLILYLSRKECLCNQPVMRTIEADLLKRAGAMTPTQFLSLTTKFRRFLFLLSIATDQRLRSLILDDPEPFNRLLLLNEFEFSQITSREVARLKTDKSIFIRRQLFYTQIHADIFHTRDELMTLACDSNRSLRELGRFYLKQNFGLDVYLIYRGLADEKFYYLADFARPEDTEYFLEGVRSGSRLTQYNCLRALASAAPERLIELGISSLICQSRKFRSVLLPLLPALLDIEEILALRSAFEASSPRGLENFFRTLERKSFWTFIDEGLAVLLTHPDHPLQMALTCAIQDKVSIYESLSSLRRGSIALRLSSLRKRDSKQNRGLIELIDFSMRKAPSTDNP